MNKAYKADSSLLVNNYERTGLTISKGDGSFVFDSEGRKYLDLISGLAVNLLGYNFVGLSKAIQAQSKRLLHVSNLYFEENQLKYARFLLDESRLSKVFFCNSGSEAIDTCIKIARKYSYEKYGDYSRNKIICMQHSFHGRTYGAFSASDSPKLHRIFGPVLPGFIFCKYNCTPELDALVDGGVCAILIELVQGHSDVKIIEKAFVSRIKEVCAKKDILLIIDEAQTAVGRTGRYFGFQTFGVLPDLVALSKPLDGGLPLGAVICGRKTADVLEPNEHGSTFGGNPLSCVSGLFVSRYINRKPFLRKVSAKSKVFVKELEKIKKKHFLIKEVRVLGLIIGIEFHSNAQDVKELMTKKGLLVSKTTSCIIRLLPHMR